MGKLLLLFIVVPAVELLLLIKIGQQIGVLATVGLIVGTGMLGAFLARRQGMGVLQNVQAEMAAGRMPTSSIVDGVIILVAGALLITPGVLTDLLSFLCLIPVSRKVIRSILWRAFERAVRESRVHVSMHGAMRGGSVRPDGWGEPGGERTVRDIKPESEPESLSDSQSDAR